MYIEFVYFGLSPVNATIILLFLLVVLSYNGWFIFQILRVLVRVGGVVSSLINRNEFETTIVIYKPLTGN